MDPRKFLEIARLFVTSSEKTPRTASGYKTAISRSYNALYGVVCELLDLADIAIIEPRKGHDAAKQVLSFCSDPGAKSIGHDLKTLHGQRWSADYAMKDQTIETENTALTVFSH